MNSNFELAPADWATLRRLLDDALDQPLTERGTWVEQLNAEFDAFKPRLRTLLALAAQGTGALPLDSLPRIETAQFLADRRTETDGLYAGGTVGPYCLIRLLGEGGMGEVWLAERTDILQRRQVALKLPHLLTGRAALAERLAREREILAGLNHPHIARLYDAGITTDSQPYLALEYVEGERIDAYCTRNQLDVRARLRLFLQVARAVAHAHANLIVHRDLKPTNILVTGAGDVKLLDFGIAKLLEDGRAQETELTQLAGRALTPEYAAPEQILGQPISTAADVYALGVVLFELLTGERPYKLGHDSRSALEEAIVQADPARPSATVSDPKLRRALRGDVDTILLKALKKSQSERYGTVEAFAEDIERHLRNEPVLAQSDSSLYRIRKFVARNRLAVGASATVAVAVLSGAGLAVWQAERALAEQRRAEEVKDFIVSIFQGADLYRGGGQPLSVVDLLNQARDRVDRSLAGRPALRLEMLTLIGYSLNNLHEVKSAEAVLRDAVAEGRVALGDEHPLMLRAREAHALTLRYAGSARAQREALQSLIPALRLQGDAMVPELARALESQVVLAWAEGRNADAESDAREMLALVTSRLDANHALTTDAMWALATSLQHQNKLGEALEIARQAYPRTLARFNGNTRAPAAIEAGASYGRLLSRAGDFEAGLPLQAQSVADAGEVFGPHSPAVAFMAANLARAQLEAGELKAALASVELALPAMEKTSGRNSPGYATVLERRAIILLAARRPREAAKLFGDVVAAFEGLRGPGAAPAAELDRIQSLALDGDLASAQRALDNVVANPAGAKGVATDELLRIRAMLLRLSGDGQAAIPLLDQALAATPGDAKAAQRRLAVLTELGIALVQARDSERATSVLQDALALSTKLQRPDTPARADIWIALGRAHLAGNDVASARPHLQQADAFWRSFDSGNRWAGEAAYWLARTDGATAPGSSAAYARAAEILARSRLPGDAELAAAAARRR